MDRSSRQQLVVKRWINEVNGCGTFVAATGVGKTRTAILAIDRLVRVNPDAFILVVVPTRFLKSQWIEELTKFKLLNKCQVEVVNTVVSNEYNCDLLVIDEAHMVCTETLSEVFNVVSYKLILCLTATLERLDGKEELVKKYAPVFDTVTLQEAETNGWVSPYKEYVVLLDVDLTEYKKLDQKFNANFSYFNWDYNSAMRCVTDWSFRTNYARKMGLPPKTVLAMCMEWNRCMRLRKEFVQSHPKKLEVCRKILNARKDKKCITFSATIKEAEALKMGQVIHSKKSSKSNAEIIKNFNEASTGVLCTSKAADVGVDIKGLSVEVIMSVDSSKIRKTQRIGRTIRREEGKTAEIFTLIIKGTQEWRWFQNSNTSKVTIIDEEQLDKVLNGEEIETRARDLFEDKNLRY